MSRRRSDPFEKQLRPAALAGRLALLFVVVVACGASALLLAGRWRSGGGLDGGRAPGLNVAESLYLQAYLASKQDALVAPAGAGAASQTFTIAAGERADQITANLVAAGLVTDGTLFLNYLRYHGLDARLEAGTFSLSPSLTVPELAEALTEAFAQEVAVRFVEGWRLEEMAAYLAESGPAGVDPAVFTSLARREHPLEGPGYAFLASLPEAMTLEGYLFPDTYRLALDAAAADLVLAMLDNFDGRVTPAMRQSFGAQGLSVHEAVTLASIVEREAAVAAERPLMAGVFLNRLAQGMPLQADPTVQFALGYQADLGTWWKSPLAQADLEFDSPYNTYRYAGLPPGPIANPGLASLQAVAAPETSDFLFFVIDCTAAVAGTHVFSATFEEHVAHVERCR